MENKSHFIAREHHVNNITELYISYLSFLVFISKQQLKPLTLSRITRGKNKLRHTGLSPLLQKKLFQVCLKTFKNKEISNEVGQHHLLLLLFVATLNFIQHHYHHKRTILFIEIVLQTASRLTMTKYFAFEL